MDNHRILRPSNIITLRCTNEKIVNCFIDNDGSL